MIEIPASWYLDDLPPMMFIKKAPNSHGFVNPYDIEQIWREQFDWVYREMDYAVFPITIHPDVSGRPQVLMMLERLYNHIIRHPGVKFLTMDEIADDFARRQPRKPYMCGLCGVLGDGTHWADGLARPGEALLPQRCHGCAARHGGGGLHWAIPCLAITACRWPTGRGQVSCCEAAREAPRWSPGSASFGRKRNGCAAKRSIRSTLRMLDSVDAACNE